MENEFLKVAFSSFSHKFTKKQVVDGRFYTSSGIITAVKNEFECAQIILTAKQDIFFDIELTDFIDGRGNFIKKENIKLFVERYCNVVRCGDYKGNFPDGYPDPMMPYENVILNKDNFIKKDENEIILIEFNSVVDQVAGEYCGDVKITVNNECLVFPLVIKVLDVAIDSGTSQNTLFNFDASCISYFEEDNMSKCMYDKYVDLAISSRIGVTHVLPKFDWTDDGIKNAVNEMYNFIKKGGSFTSIPTYPRTYIKGKSIFDRDILIKYIFEIAVKSMETGLNLVNKIGFYDWCMDEPFCLQRIDGGIYDGLVENEILSFKDCVGKVVDKLTRDKRFNTDFGKEIIKSVREFRHIITDYYDFKQHDPKYVQKNKKGQDLKYDVKDVVLCPKFDGLDTPEHRAPYKGAEVWWYNCGEPNGPFPTYHIDENLSAPKILTWMMSDYGVKGNLYWNCTANTEIMEDFSVCKIKDPYGISRGYGVNGEGTLVYPGKPYGVVGPINSIRFAAIRDGQEDYEMLSKLKAEYKRLDKDFDGIYSRITCLLYNNAKVDYYGDAYDTARRNALNLLVLASKYGVTIESKSDSINKFYFYGNIKKIVVDGKVYDDIREISLPIDREWVNINISVGAEKFEFDFYLGKGLKIYMNHEISEAVYSGDIEKIDYDNRECVYHTIIKLSDKGKKLVFNYDEDFTTLTKIAICFLVKYSTKYKIYSGGKEIMKGEFISLDKEYGTGNRIDILASLIVDNVFTLELLDTDFIGIRETYIYG